MKKLIIAASIAAATMASFGASATEYTSNASVNTVVTGTTGFQISATDGKLSAEQFKAVGADLGAFIVKAPDGASVVSLSDIHAHNYPNGYVVKIADNNVDTCTATLASGVDNSFGLQNKCDFDVSGDSPVTLSVTNNSVFNDEVVPGTKTLTVTFKSTVN